MYDGKFFKRSVAKYHKKEMKLARLLYGLWHPESVIDVGCGIGSYLAGFYRCNPGMALCGLDVGARYAIDYCDKFIRPCITEAHAGEDLTDWPRQYDLVLCIEVAEHLPEHYSLQMCKNLRHMGRNRILMTAAAPGQRGAGHVNCQEQGWWIDRMEADGWAYDELDRAEIAFVWHEDPLNLLKNLMVFRKADTE